MRQLHAHSQGASSGREWSQPKRSPLGHPKGATRDAPQRSAQRRHPQERVRERTAALHLGESELSDVATQRCLRCWNPLRLQGGNKFALCPDWAPRDDVA